MKSFNINTKVRVELTPSGVVTFMSHPYHSSYDIEEVHGKVYFIGQLWELMKIFGPCMYNGNMNLPFVDNMLSLSEEW